MAKIAAVSGISILSGIVCFFGSIFFLMQLGLQRFDNYEYYGQYPVLYFGPGVAGFLIPWIVFWVWRIGRRKNKLMDSGTANGPGD